MIRTESDFVVKFYYQSEKELERSEDGCSVCVFLSLFLTCLFLYRFRCFTQAVAVDVRTSEAGLQILVFFCSYALAYRNL